MGIIRFPSQGKHQTADAARQADFTFTKEQETIFSSNEQVILINAFAGCAKTSTLLEFTRRRPDLYFIYLAFNQTAKVAAENSFPANVRCMTTHGLAFPEFGSRYKHKIGNPTAYGLARLYGWDIPSTAKALKVLSSFLHSKDRVIHVEHVVSAGLSELIADYAIHAANLIWSAMCDTGNMHVKMEHDGYLKLLQMSNPVLRADYILLDEAQDSNPAIIDIVDQQNCKKIIVGDRFQGIYRWRNAVNAMDLIRSDAKYPLLSSFRFGHGIASLASQILFDWHNEKQPLRGLGKHETTWGVDRSGPHTVIARTNAGLFDEAAREVTSHRPIRFVGGIERYRFDQVLDVYHLKNHNLDAIQDKYIQSYGDWGLYVATAESLEDKEAKALIKLTNEYDNEIPSLVRQVKLASNKPLLGDEIQFVTAHRSKGLEWENVRLLHDFSNLAVKHDAQTNKIELPDKEEINLLYVACTRALKSLQPNRQIISWLKDANHKFLLAPMFSGMASASSCNRNAAFNRPAEGSVEVRSNKQQQCHC